MEGPATTMVLHMGAERTRTGARIPGKRPSRRAAHTRATNHP